LIGPLKDLIWFLETLIGFLKDFICTSKDLISFLDRILKHQLVSIMEDILNILLEDQSNLSCEAHGSKNISKI